jgi:hypothetical protein
MLKVLGTIPGSPREKKKNNPEPQEILIPLGWEPAFLISF